VGNAHQTIAAVGIAHPTYISKIKYYSYKRAKYLNLMKHKISVGWVRTKVRN